MRSSVAGSRPSAVAGAGATFKLSSSMICVLSTVLVGYLLILYAVLSESPPTKGSSITSDCSDSIKSAIAAANSASAAAAIKNPLEELRSQSQLLSAEQEVKKLSNEINGLKESLAIATAAAAAANAQIDVVSSSSSRSSSSGGNSYAYRPGLIILGMHRSGTSIVGGLLNKMGLNAGGPLIRPASDNEKGFFERIDVVLQNDAIMRKQHVDYSLNTVNYNAEVGIKDVLNDKDQGKFFAEGRRGLSFLNDAKNYPWMLKDPRLCITLRTWLPLLNFLPAVLFTYRHPFDVAMSLKNRYEHFQIARTLKMWYVYNKRAIQQSHDLCRVLTSHKRMMTQPKVELQRIYQELLSCGLPSTPLHMVSDVDIADFVDPKLQHGKSAVQEAACQSDISTLQVPESWSTTEQQHIKLYREAMRAYCAMEDGSAFKHDFNWDNTITDT